MVVLDAQKEYCRARSMITVNHEIVKIGKEMYSILVLHLKLCDMCFSKMEKAFNFHIYLRENIVFRLQ